MKNVFLSMLAISFLALSCKKKETENNTDLTDSANANNIYSDTAGISPEIPADTASVHDSMNNGTNTTTTGGRKTSNNNTGNRSGNVNAAVSDTTGATR
ncbi:hypothetical protein [Chryseobacterium tongliaoense]|uniref:hypothetical protein n=1 Tax=Chryseobacterium tongliaoense TaxID=3240933 RepID=UPI003518ED53